MQSQLRDGEAFRVSILKLGINIPQMSDIVTVCSGGTWHVGKNAIQIASNRALADPCAYPVMGWDRQWSGGFKKWRYNMYKA